LAEAGLRWGSAGPVALSPLAEAGLRWGSGENGADSGFRSVTLHVS
jgi:hypothetical protein